MVTSLLFFVASHVVINSSDGCQHCAKDHIPIYFNLYDSRHDDYFPMDVSDSLTLYFKPLNEQAPKKTVD